MLSAERSNNYKILIFIHMIYLVLLFPFFCYISDKPNKSKSNIYTFIAVWNCSLLYGKDMFNRNDIDFSHHWEMHLFQYKICKNVLAGK